jgi:hypothetical protein
MNKLIKIIKKGKVAKPQLEIIETNLNFNSNEIQIKSNRKLNVISFSLFSLSSLLFVFSLIFFLSSKNNIDNTTIISNDSKNLPLISSVSNLYYESPTKTIEIKGCYLINVYLGFVVDDSYNPINYVLLFDYIELTNGSPRISLVINSSDYVDSEDSDYASNYYINIEPSSYLVNSFPDTLDTKPIEITFITKTVLDKTSFSMDLVYLYNVLVNTKNNNLGK